MKIQVYPMDYEEFCMATDNNYELLQQIYHMNSAIGQATNRKLMRDLRIYMAVGGMPQAVEAYIEGKNFSEIDMVKKISKRLMHREEYLHCIIQFRRNWQRIHENTELQQQ